MTNWVHAGALEELKEEGAKVIKGGIAVFYHEEKVYAVDNRCPHMGFPLHMGSLCDGILTCHWHHARFDVCSGGTLDPWADDVPTYPVKLEAGEIYVNPKQASKGDAERHFQRLHEGLEQNLSLVIAKSVVALVEAGVPDVQIARVGLEYGTTYRSGGWGSGLTILAAMVNILPKLDHYNRILALYHGLTRVAADCSGRPPKFLMQALPNDDVTIDRLTTWYRQCIEVRDTQGAERVLLTAIRSGIDKRSILDMMLMAATDHFYLDGGHTFDFHNKAFEMLEKAGDELAERVLASLVPLLGNPSRSEERHSWLHPINLVTPLHQAFEELPKLAERSVEQCLELDEGEFIHQLLGDQPLAAIDAITQALLGGAAPVHVARLVALAAAERINRFHTQNDFGDWIAVLHTFTHAHAVHESLLRGANDLAIRAIYYAGVSIYLDRFLNIPAASPPTPEKYGSYGYTTDLNELLELMDQRQRVAEAANWVAHYLDQGGDAEPLFNTLGHSLLREDAEFHSFQMIEAAIQEYDHWSNISGTFANQAKRTMILATTRYLAAHAPTAREQSHIARIAWRLQRGERLFKDE
ncbi:Rieske (2Fe-2S) protein [Paenibacillus apiarius]|uniref:Rieske (2Fe-2S) protein n=1 Tax=Paenibacillus apiarius TaxID=46240 RepID=A0ABT4DQJ4_9BACL|nr:Rieske (2Fe-2S) protein [Paenibacillus apiarius]MCY9513407.1 Rieske (2Fe-2S) protein [Paenibacillus apiarius]MCY9519621.1 Rieske (2Fe-2S) protein [Paenibacillus apiarius]MCY9553323.1 Rieske (2Fe-2S) protein [Paenibacillus apiarius]MCY9557173.1 Rieske (2Fe-2S) protein [Paenibacillus apiarius]MCY9682086.1 Rieske (2Fe-2S) protein [Paenibacillus apiarius]